MAAVFERPEAAGVGQGATRLMRIGSAVLSVALVVGVGIWGYRLVMRDVNGIPVVRAMEGPMRLSPDNPGGEVNPHRGLAVNAIAAEGEAAGPEDTLFLAPQAIGLAPEDFEIGTSAEAAEVMAADLPGPQDGRAIVTPVVGTEPEMPLAVLTVLPAAAPAAPLTAEQVLAMADEITAGVAPLSELAPGPDRPVAVSIEAAAPVADAGVAVIPASVAGLVSAMRPPARPATLTGGSAEAMAPAAPATAEPEVRVEDFSAGTTLVQFGAFDTPALAAEAWAALSGRFGDFLTDHAPVYQEATSGGRTFYRLRTLGFANRAEAQRFCAAFTAEATECVPHVVQ